jgi:hypothetical protein
MRKSEKLSEMFLGHMEKATNAMHEAIDSREDLKELVFHLGFAHYEMLQGLIVTMERLRCDLENYNERWEERQGS